MCSGPTGAAGGEWAGEATAGWFLRACWGPGGAGGFLPWILDLVVTTLLPREGRFAQGQAANKPGAAECLEAPRRAEAPTSPSRQGVGVQRR